MKYYRNEDCTMSHLLIPAYVLAVFAEIACRDSVELVCFLIIAIYTVLIHFGFKVRYGWDYALHTSIYIDDIEVRLELWGFVLKTIARKEIKTKFVIIKGVEYVVFSDVTIPETIEGIYGLKREGSAILYPFNRDMMVDNPDLFKD